MNELERLEKILKDDHVLLTGGGGVGKSYLSNKLIKAYRSKGKQVVVLGSTGISAVHVEGQTIHSFFVFGISGDVDAMKRNDRYNKQRLREMNKILSSCDLLVIDEISMVSTELMEMIRYRLTQGKFSGSLLLVGDFFQLPPVSKRNTNALFQDALYAFESTAWSVYEPKIVTLKTPKRTEDLHFFSILNRIRRGEVDNEIMQYLSKLAQNNAVWSKDPTVLYGRNAEADRMNRARLQEIDSELVILKAEETLHEKALHVKRLETWKKSLPVSDAMELKVGASVLFCTNKWGKYYNGERGIIKDIDEDKILVEKTSGVVEVERHEYVLHENVQLDGEIEEKPLASLRQFPLKLAYAITIHKSQGMSIDALVCNIDNIFEASQFYVAISRAKDPKVLKLDFNRGNFDQYIRNCIRVDERVIDFYANSQQCSIENDAGVPTLF